MSLRPTQEIKNAIGPATTFHVTTTPPLSSRAKPRDLQFRGPLMETRKFHA
jgi:hypothetical protein